MRIRYYYTVITRWDHILLHYYRPVIRPLIRLFITLLFHDASSGIKRLALLKKSRVPDTFIPLLIRPLIRHFYSTAYSTLLLHRYYTTNPIHINYYTVIPRCISILPRRSVCQKLLHRYYTSGNCYLYYYIVITLLLHGRLSVITK